MVKRRGVSKAEETRKTLGGFAKVLEQVSAACTSENKGYSKEVINLKERNASTRNTTDVYRSFICGIHYTE